MVRHAGVVRHHLAVHNLLHGQLVCLLSSSPLGSAILKPDLDEGKGEEKRNMRHRSLSCTESGL